VGQLVEIAVEKGRRVRHDLKIGICGEHGGDPASITFFNRVGLDYVSCSPSRVPVARLAAAQAEIQNAIRAVDSDAILDDLARGQLDRQQVQALKIINPELYEEVQSRMANYVVENRPEVTRQQQVALSIITGKPNIFTAPEVSGGTDGANWFHVFAHAIAGFLVSLVAWLLGSVILFVTRKLKPA
jgi:hypothetical protein